MYEPASGQFDLVIAPGQNVADALADVRHGASVLLLPGLHLGPITLTKAVHIFGRGQACVRMPGQAGAAGTSSAGRPGPSLAMDVNSALISSFADVATCDGLTLRQVRTCMYMLYI